MGKRKELDPKEVQAVKQHIQELVRRLGFLDKRRLACCGVSLAQCHALIEIGSSGPLSLGDLAQKLNVDNSTMSRTVNNLVGEGLVERETDSQDRRFINIRLTKEGERILKGIEAERNRYYQEVLHRIPSDQRGKVVEGLRLLVDSLSIKGERK